MSWLEKWDAKFTIVEKWEYVRPQKNWKISIYLVYSKSASKKLQLGPLLVSVKK